MQALEALHNLPYIRGCRVQSLPKSLALYPRMGILQEAPEMGAILKPVLLGLSSVGPPTSRERTVFFFFHKILSDSKLRRAIK